MNSAKVMMLSLHLKKRELMMNIKSTISSYFCVISNIFLYYFSKFLYEDKIQFYHAILRRTLKDLFFFKVGWQK